MAYDYISRGKAKENGYTNTRVFKMFGVSSGAIIIMCHAGRIETVSRQLKKWMKAM